MLFGAKVGHLICHDWRVFRCLTRIIITSLIIAINSRNLMMFLHYSPPSHRLSHRLDNQRCVWRSTQWPFCGPPLTSGEFVSWRGDKIGSNSSVNRHWTNLKGQTYVIWPEPCLNNIVRVIYFTLEFELSDWLKMVTWRGGNVDTGSAPGGSQSQYGRLLVHNS